MYIPQSVRTTSERNYQCQKVTTSLPLLTIACDWTGVSDRLAAILATSVLHDLAVVSPIDQSKLLIEARSTKNAAKLARNFS